MSAARNLLPAVLLVAMADTAAAQRPAPPAPPTREQTRAAVAKLLPGNEKSHYVLVLAETTPDHLRFMPNFLAFSADMVSLPVKGLLAWHGHHVDVFGISKATEAVIGKPRPTVTVEVGAFAGRKGTIDAVTDYVRAAPTGKVRQFLLVKRPAGRAAAAKAADAEKARLDTLAAKEKTLTVTRRADD